MGTKPSWRIRRLVIFAVLALCFYVVIRITESDRDRPVDEVLVYSSFLTITAVVGAYVFGATWESVKLEPPRRRNRDTYDTGSTYDYGG